MSITPLQHAAGARSSSAFVPSWTPRRETTATLASRILDRFEPTTLAEMDDVALLSRVDTKYLLPASHVSDLLSSLAADYRVLDIDGRRAHRYRTLYFDTPDLQLYRRHHEGRPVRHKVRSRQYLDTGLTYFEVKARSSEGRTLKHRLRTAAPLISVTPEARALLARHLPASERAVGPTIWNDFVRITLVGLHSAERLTLDLGLRFELDGRTAILPNLVIAELKQSRADGDSPFTQQMRSRQVRPISISKYCVGVAILAPNVERVAFDEKLRAIETVMRGDLTPSETERAQ